jgi:hypothetical protein
MDAGGIATANAYIMQHGCFLQELHIDRQFPVFLGNLQTTVCHLAAMLQ